MDINEIKECLREKYGYRYVARLSRDRKQKIYIEDIKEYVRLSTYVCEYGANKSERQKKCMELNKDSLLINFLLGEARYIEAEILLLKDKLEKEELEIAFNTLANEADKWEFLLSKGKADEF